MKKSIIIGAVCMAAVASQAATITWQSSVQMYQGTTSQTFVDTTGSLVLGFTGSATTTGNITVNGVNFDYIDGAVLNGGYTDNGVTISSSTVLGGHDTAFGDGSFDSDGNIYNLIASGMWGPTTVSLSGLTVGQEYMFQIFVNDSRTGSGRDSDWQTGFTDGVGTGTGSITGAASLNNRDPSDFSGETSGDYIIGTFTADAATQSFETYGTSDGGATWTNSSRAQLNGLQIRAIPEPATLGLVAAFGGAVLFIRRRFMI